VFAKDPQDAFADSLVGEIDRLSAELKERDEKIEELKRETFFLRMLIGMDATKKIKKESVNHFSAT